MSATDLQTLLRFLSQEAKVPLASALSKVKELQTASLDSPDKLSKAKIDELKPIFPDDKVAKQVLAAAKRVAKKRAAGEDVTSTSPQQKRKKKSDQFADAEISPEDLESSLELPSSTLDEQELARTVLFTNRAPLALAFVLTLLKFSMPEQPLSSRLSLAQGYISVTSRARAVYLGIEKGRSAEEEGFGEGAPSVRITGKEIKVLRRWDYGVKDSHTRSEGSGEGDQVTDESEANAEADADAYVQPALWAVDLEAVKKSNNTDPIISSAQPRSASKTGLPIYTPQSARAYLLKAFDTASEGDEKTSTTKKPSFAAKAAEKERNLGMLLRVLDLLYESWAVTLGPEDLDKRTWSWYVKVRPDVADGVAGWGGKNRLKLAEILALRRESEGVGS